jgi:hypothetical protein
MGTQGMTEAIEPDPGRLDQYVRTKLRAAATAAMVVLPVGATLYIEYRVMILCIAMLLFPLIPFTFGVSARRQVGAGGALRVEVSALGLEVTLHRPTSAPPSPGYRDAQWPAAECNRYPLTAVLRAVIHTDALILVVKNGPGANAFRRYIVPGSPERVRVVADALRASGVTVIEEPTSSKVAQFVVTVVVGKVFGVVAGALVLGAVSNIVLAMMKGDGSFLRGLLFFGGALTALVARALLQRWFVPRAHD